MKEYKGGLLWGDGLFRRRNISYPFAKLIVGQDHIILQLPTSEFRLGRKEIVGISTKNRIFYKGIVLKHSNSDVPKTLVFWTFQAPAVLLDLNQLIESHK